MYLGNIKLLPKAGTMPASYLRPSTKGHPKRFSSVTGKRLIFADAIQNSVMGSWSTNWIYQRGRYFCFKTGLFSISNCPDKFVKVDEPRIFRDVYYLS